MPGPRVDAAARQEKPTRPAEPGAHQASRTRSPPGQPNQEPTRPAEPEPTRPAEPGAHQASRARSPLGQPGERPGGPRPWRRAPARSRSSEPSPFSGLPQRIAPNSINPEYIRSELIGMTLVLASDASTRYRSSGRVTVRVRDPAIGPHPVPSGLPANSTAVTSGLAFSATLGQHPADALESRYVTA